MTNTNTTTTDALTFTISTCPVRDHKLAVEGLSGVLPYPAHCRMGQDYDCGCYYCAPYVYVDKCAKAKAHAIAWNAATVEVRAHVAMITSVFAVLARIGQAFALVAEAHRSVSVFVANVVASYEAPTKGARYQITGKRGNAKAHFGKVGVCKWVGHMQQGDRYGRNVRWVTKLGLAIEGEAKLVYVTESNVTRIRETPTEIAAVVEGAIVKAAIAPLRAKWVPGKLTGKGRNKSYGTAYVVSGRDKGHSGRVFWLGPDSRTNEVDARLGIATDTGLTLWVSAYECRNELPENMITDRDEVAFAKRVAADAAEAGETDKARAILARVTY